MALTYADSSALMVNQPFRDRVKVACLMFASYISNEAPDVVAHNTRFKWAQNTLMAPDVAVGVVISSVVMDPQVQADGDTITDVALQTVVESSLNKLL